MAQPMRGGNGRPQRGSFTSSVPPERWTAIIVLACLGLLIAIRMGFRGVNVMGVSASVN